MSPPPPQTPRPADPTSVAWTLVASLLPPADGAPSPSRPPASRGRRPPTPAPLSRYTASRSSGSQSPRCSASCRRGHRARRHDSACVPSRGVEHHARPRRHREAHAVEHAVLRQVGLVINVVADIPAAAELHEVERLLRPYPWTIESFRHRLVYVYMDNHKRNILNGV